MQKRGPKVKHTGTNDELRAAAVAEVQRLAVNGVAPSAAQYDQRRAAGCPCSAVLYKRGVRYAEVVRAAGLQMPRAMATMVRRFEESVNVPAEVEAYCAREPRRAALRYDEQGEGLRVVRRQVQEFTYEAGGVVRRVEREICLLR